MTFLVIARDGNDAEAPARRQAVRQRHLDEIRPLVEDGVVQLGGAILDDAGGMVGSALIVEAESREALVALLERDVYWTGGVWRSFEIHPFRRAV